MSGQRDNQPNKPCVLCLGTGLVTLCKLVQRGYTKHPNSPCICPAGQAMLVSGKHEPRRAPKEAGTRRGSR